MLFLVRHADAGNKHLWRADDALRPLSLLGRRQAVGLVETFRDLSVLRIVSSPHVRCRQTVEPLASVLGLPVLLSDDLLPDASVSDLESELRLPDDNGTARCTHGEILTRIIGRWRTSRLVDIPASARWEKGGTWLVDEDSPGERPSATYLPPRLGSADGYRWAGRMSR